MTRPTQPAKLCPADADALDALVEAGFDPQLVPPFLQQRAARLAAMFNLLEPAGFDDASAPAASSLHSEPTLSALDAAALDAMVEANWLVKNTSAEHAVRAGHLATVLSLLDSVPQLENEIDGDALIDATWLRIEHAELAPMRVASRRALRLPRVRLMDIATAAAIFLVASSILWPMLTGVRREHFRIADQARLQNAGLGFGLYANDHRDRLPVAPTSYAGRTPGVTWWNVGQTNQSNSAHLFVLIKDGYVTVSDLASPANPLAPVRMDVANQNDWRTPEEVSYSYQLPGQSGRRWTTPSRHVVLADRSPVIEQARRGDAVNPMLNSFIHRGAGQNVLFSDRSVRWLTSPVTDWGDNIWLPRSLERRLGATLLGVELPDNADDAFVGP